MQGEKRNHSYFAIICLEGKGVLYLRALESFRWDQKLMISHIHFDAWTAVANGTQQFSVHYFNLCVPDGVHTLWLKHFMVKWKHIRHHCPSPSSGPHRRGRECCVGLWLPTILSRGHTKNPSILQGEKNRAMSHRSLINKYCTAKITKCHNDDSFTLKMVEPLHF